MRDRRDVQKRINEERANPGGGVDLALLHDLGQRMQADDAAIAQEKVEYARLTKKAFAESSCK